MKDANRAPFYACMYHGLCDTARRHGYALAIHGSVVTDLDLIAIPWTESAVSADELYDALMKHIGAVDYEGLTRRQFPDNPELVDQILSTEAKRNAESGLVHDEAGAEMKPHGRRAWNLYMDAGAKVDLSVMPRKQDFQSITETLKSADGPEDSAGMTPIPGIKAHHRWITDTCRANRGDVGAMSEAAQTLQLELLNLYKHWPAGAGTRFHLVLTVEPMGRNPENSDLR